MEIKIEDKTMKIIHYRQHRNDSDYGTCLGADFVIDADRLSLEIYSDCGNMQYTWSNIGDNTPAGFYCFLERLNKDYFLRKMSSETRFNFNATVEHLLKWLEDSRPELASEVRSMQPCFNEHEFAAEYMALPGSHTDDLECVVMDYPAGHKKVADIFCHYVQPAMLDCIPPEADAYFLEVEADYTTKELADLVAKLDPAKQYVPMQVEGEYSLAFGFVESETFERLLCDDNGEAFSAEMLAVLNDMNKENSEGLYVFAEVRTHLCR